MLYFLEWLFTETIWGAVIVASIVYAASKFLSKKINKLPKPEFIAGALFILLIAFLPSLPRYNFEKKVQQEIKDKPYFKLVKTVNWGDLAEPATWINAPIGMFRLASPDPTTYKKGVGGIFQEIVIRYKEEPMNLMVEAVCASKTISISQKETDGTFLSLKNKERMSDDDFSIYCETDFTEEAEIARKELSSSN